MNAIKIIIKPTTALYSSNKGILAHHKASPTKQTTTANDKVKQRL